MKRQKQLFQGTDGVVGEFLPPNIDSVACFAKHWNLDWGGEGFNSRAQHLRPPPSALVSVPKWAACVSWLSFPSLPNDPPGTPARKPARPGRTRCRGPSWAPVSACLWRWAQGTWRPGKSRGPVSGSWLRPPRPTVLRNHTLGWDEQGHFLMEPLPFRQQPAQPAELDVVPGRESLASYDHPQVMGPRVPGTDAGRKPGRLISLRAAVSPGRPSGRERPWSRAQQASGEDRGPLWSGAGPSLQ